MKNEQRGHCADQSERPVSITIHMAEKSAPE